MQKLRHPPIVEAVVDIDCDMPSTWDLASAEGPAGEAMGDRYPVFRAKVVHEAQIEAPAAGSPSVSMRKGLHALQYVQQDERQLVQIRKIGYSFNRLAPYSGLDDYLLEIERTWLAFVRVASPLQVRQVRLRYINRILLPVQGRETSLDQYLQIGPRLPDADALIFESFLHRHVFGERATGHRVQTTLASQAVEGGRLPLILDIEAISDVRIESGNWTAIQAVISSLRLLKNQVFERTLTPACLTLFS